MAPSDRETLGKAGRTAEELAAKLSAVYERELQKHLRNLLAQRDIVCGVSIFGRKSTYTEGWPDITFALDGRACAWECKIRADKPSAEQAAMHRKMRANGWLVAVVRNLDEARAFLDVSAKPRPE